MVYFSFNSVKVVNDPVEISEGEILNKPTYELISHVIDFSSFAVSYSPSTENYIFELVYRYNNEEMNNVKAYVSAATIVGEQQMANVFEEMAVVISTRHFDNALTNIKFLSDFLDKNFGKHKDYYHKANQVSEIERMAKQLPGVTSYVDFPCQCWTSKSTLFNVIIHLNDQCKWSREKIADWIDRLHDDGKINAEFQPWNGEQPVINNNVDMFEHGSNIIVNDDFTKVDSDWNTYKYYFTSSFTVNKDATININPA